MAPSNIKRDPISFQPIPQGKAPAQPSGQGDQNIAQGQPAQGQTQAEEPITTGSAQNGESAQQNLLARAFTQPEEFAQVLSTVLAKALQDVQAKYVAQPAHFEEEDAPFFEEPDENEDREHPWKYGGYRDFARWVASDQAWFITRRFSTLNARVILQLQDNVVRLEEQLDRLDRQYRQPDSLMGDGNRTHNGSFRLESFEERKKVLKNLAAALKEYNSFVNEYSQLASRPLVRQQDVEDVRGWLNNNKFAIADEEAAYMDPKHSDDLIPVHPKTRSWFRTVLEKTHLLRKRPLKGCLSRKPCDPLISQRNTDTLWHNDTRVEKLSAFVIGGVGLMMLIGPIWALDKAPGTDVRLGIITAFIIVFYVLVGIATTAKVFESLAAVAAYSAVLMVFMQIQQPAAPATASTP